MITGFSIVGIGASAGGLEALTKLLTSLPTDTGMSFVLLQHLDPKHDSMSAEILSRVTKMPVREVKNGDRAKPNCVYIIPPGFKMGILQGVLNLLPRTKDRSQHLVIDFFFKSLAQDQKNRAMGVVLSGTGTDGTEGLMAIKAEGGITISQDPKSAKFDSMPLSAIASGTVDFVLSPTEISVELARIARHPYVSPPTFRTEPLTSTSDHNLSKIFLMLRNECHLDFTLYKSNTIRRRLERRMLLHKMDDLEKYVDFLSEHPEEVKALYADILIHVTEFFRDPEAFQALKTEVFPTLMTSRAANSPIRIWVPACSTGEEVYSIAISLVEFLGEKASHTPIQIFATDVSEKAINKARTGEYVGISETVSPERLNRYFIRREGGGFKISKSIRDICLFSRHDITRDPPFAKTDFISCRNLLIYFTPALQKHVFPIFHYALRPEGFLWLGKSETVGSSELFSLVDKENKIYSRKNITSTLIHRFPPNRYVSEKAEVKEPEANFTKTTLNVQNLSERALQVEYPGFLVNEDMEIIQVRGQTMPYIEIASGAPSHHLFKMVHPDLVRTLRTTLQTVQKLNKTVKKEGLSIGEGPAHKTFNLNVIPVKLPNSKERLYLVLFEKTVESKPKKGKRLRVSSQQKKNKTRGKKAPLVLELQEELSELKEYQHSLIEKFEAAQEDLTTANEELQSANEELQSTNEELETAKEELQSGNEELSTVNDELQVRSSEQTQTNNDLINLLGSVEIPIVMLGDDRKVRRFTPLAGKALNLIAADIGRPMSDLRLNFITPDNERTLEDMVSETIETMAFQEIEIQDLKGRWFRLQVRPYKTVDNKIDGAVLAFVDIDRLKRVVENLEAEREIRERFVMTLSHDLRTPMTSAKITAQLLHRTSEDPATVKTLADKVVRSMNRADRMIHDLLDANRINAGEGIPISIGECPLDQVLETVVSDLSEIHGARFQIQNKAGPLIGSFDRIAIHRVIENLANNAIKYGDPKAPITISLTKGTSWIEIAVHNEGKAISESDQKTLFNPYRRTESANQSGQKGWGIGLTLVKGIAEAHGGTVRVRSTPEQGTTFVIQLPLTSVATS